MSTLRIGKIGRKGRPRREDTDLLSEPQIMPYRTLYSYGQINYLPYALNMREMTGVPKIRKITERPKPRLRERFYDYPKPAIAPKSPIPVQVDPVRKPEDDYKWVPQFRPTIPQAPPLVPESPPNVEEIENNIDMIDDAIDNMPLDEVEELNDKLKNNEKINNEDLESIAPNNSQLLEDIRRGIKLKKVRQEEKEDDIESQQDLLKEMLRKRRKMIQGGKLYDTSQLDMAQRIYNNYFRRNLYV
jgi:hypothetical protein